METQKERNCYFWWYWRVNGSYCFGLAQQQARIIIGRDLKSPTNSTTRFR